MSKRRRSRKNKKKNKEIKKKLPLSKPERDDHKIKKDDQGKKTDESNQGVDKFEEKGNKNEHLDEAKNKEKKDQNKEADVEADKKEDKDEKGKKVKDSDEKISSEPKVKKKKVNFDKKLVKGFQARFKKLSNSSKGISDPKKEITSYLSQIRRDLAKKLGRDEKNDETLNKDYLSKDDQKDVVNVLRKSYRLREKEEREKRKESKRLKRQKRVVSRLFIVFIGVFFLFLASILFILSWFEAGSEKVEEKEIEVDSFDKITVDWRGKLLLTQGEEYSVKIEAEDNVLEWIETDLSDGHLVFSKKTWIPIFNLTKLIRNTRPIIIKVTAPDINKVELSGYSELKVDRFSSEYMELVLNDNSEGELSGLDVYDMVVKMDGYSSLKLLGKAHNQYVEIKDFSLYNGRSLKTETCDISSNDSSEAKLNIISKLMADAHNSSKIHYAGDPELEEEETDQGVVGKFGEEGGN